MRTMTPEQIEARLRDRFALLNAGDRAAPERHRTLEAVIAWSWDLLDDDARRAMARLSILPAGFSADTAAAVLGEGSIDDTLDRLASQSLLIVEDEPLSGLVRFRMLETVREFGLARLIDTGQVDAAWQGAFAWAAAFAAARVTTVFEVAVFHEIRSEHDNLIAVLRRAIEQDDATRPSRCSRSSVRHGSCGARFSEFQTFGPVVLQLVDRVGSTAMPADVIALVLLMAAVTTQIGEGRAASGRTPADLAPAPPRARHDDGGPHRRRRRTFECGADWLNWPGYAVERPSKEL